MSYARRTDWGPPPRRRHGRARVVAALTFCLLALAAIGVGGWYLVHSAGGSAKPCPTPTPLTATGRASTLPQPSQVHLVVLNGTSRAGLARGTADELQLRGFRVTQVGNAPAPYHGYAQVRYGPDVAAAGRRVALELPRAEAVPDATLTGQVALVLGDGYTRLRTPAEVRAALVRAGASSPSPAPSSASPSCRSS